MKIGTFHADNRTFLMLAGLLFFSLLVYFVVVPTVIANHYLGKVDEQLARTKDELAKVSAGQNVAAFENPDIPLAERRELLGQTLGQVQQAQNALNELEEANNLPPLPGNGFAGDYHKAVVREERTANAIKQSREVLDAYAATLAYADTHTKAQQYLEEQLQYVNSIRNFDMLVGRGGGMAAIATELQQNRQQLAAQTPPPDFAPLHDETLQILEQAATAFEYLAIGLNRGYDVTIYSAVSSLERLAEQYDVDRYDLYASLGEQSTTLRQLYELPEKIELVQEL